MILYRQKRSGIMKYIFILNAFGKESVFSLYQDIRLVAGSMGIDYKIEVNSENKSTEQILKKYQDTRDIIVAVGGDGMINKVLNGIIDTDNYFSYIPCGTGNDLDRTVKETLKQGYSFVDAIKINDRYFINNACFGIDADIANDESYIHNEYIPKSMRYDAGVLHHFLKYKPRHLEVLVNNERYEDDFTSVIVCNGRYYGGGYKIGPTSCLNDGLLELYLIEKLNKIGMASAILSTKNGKHEGNKHLKKIKADSLVINSDVFMDANIDGEKITDKTFKIELIPNKIKLLNNQILIEKVLRK